MTGPRHLVTPAGTRGIEISVTDAADGPSIGAALAAIHSAVDAQAAARSTTIASAIVSEAGSENVLLRAWAAGRSVRVEVANLPVRVAPDGFELLVRFADRWGVVDLDERTIWFEVSAPAE